MARNPLSNGFSKWQVGLYPFSEVLFFRALGSLAAVSVLIHALKSDYGHVPQAAAQVAALCGPYYSR